MWLVGSYVLVVNWTLLQARPSLKHALSPPHATLLQARPSLP